MNTSPSLGLWPELGATRAVRSAAGAVRDKVGRSGCNKRVNPHHLNSHLTLFEPGQQSLRTAALNPLNASGSCSATMKLLKREFEKNGSGSITVIPQQGEVTLRYSVSSCTTLCQLPAACVHRLHCDDCRMRSILCAGPLAYIQSSARN